MTLDTSQTSSNSSSSLSRASHDSLLDISCTHIGSIMT